MFLNSISDLRTLKLVTRANTIWKNLYFD